MKKLEKLRLKGISEILSEKELKNVLGGSNGDFGGLGSSCTANALICSGYCSTGGTLGYCSMTHINDTPICWCYSG